MRRMILATALALGLVVTTSSVASAQYYWWMGSPYAGYYNPYLHGGYGLGSQSYYVSPWTGTQVYQGTYVNPWSGYGTSYRYGYNPWTNQYRYRYNVGRPGMFGRWR